MNGPSLCCRYSLVTNELGFCGPNGVADELRNCILGKSDASPLLKRFESLYPYLEIISEKHGLKPFDEEVVEAYWIGNELSENYGENEFKELIDKLNKRGLPKPMCENLLKNSPKSMPFTHNFHVLYVGVGNVTGSVPSTLANIEKCVISLDRVEEVGELLNSKIRFDSELLSVNDGDYVAIHWNHAVQVLSERQKKNLEKFTLKAKSVIR